MGRWSDTQEAYYGDEKSQEENMSRYDDYITRLCRTGNYTPEQAKELALSKEVEKYYKSEDGIAEEKSTYTPIGECK